MNAFLRVIDALNREQEPYVVVGGFAALLHGNNRFTADLDLVVDLSPTTALKTIRTLVGMGLTARIPVDTDTFADAVTRSRWIREKQMLVFSLFDPKSALVVDRFVREPLPFDELQRDAETIVAEGFRSVSARLNI